ncbi:MAG TPA: long-chain fatty acid--CoA ligase [Gemmatimonadaceae bacterium]|nr:long-chain fatty acid--CoA ligase [Gemmatimonadaceae bacterium]
MNYYSGGPRNSAPGTLNQLFFTAIETFDKPDALQVKRDGTYRPISSRELADHVRQVALGLQELGIKRGDRVAILSENRPEWVVADFACLTSGVTDVPVYPTLPAEQIPYILNDSASVAVFTSTPEQAAKIAQMRSQMRTVKHVIGFGTARNPGEDYTLDDVRARGRALDNASRAASYRAQALAVQPDDLATLIYTSGTTGDPKGVMLTHDNLYSNVFAAAAAVPFGGHDVTLSFLPLSHSFARLADYYLMIHTGTTISYAESMDTIAVNLSEVRPTLVLSVPRVFEKLYARVLDNARSGSGIKKRIFFWARGIGERWAREKLAGREPRGVMAAQYALAQKLVFSKLKARVGGRMRYFVSGGAPLAPEINNFFYAAGLVILEGYGLTETSPVISVNTPENNRIGSVGKPVAGVEVQIADDGEILTRGPHVMKGYYNKPDATREAIDSDGWFHTGDIGVLEDGFIRITDRKKDIIVTAGGKNIAPQPIENKVKTNKYVSQAVMIGDKRKFPVMLIVPNWDNLEKWAKIKNILWTDRAQLLAMPTIKAKVEKEVMAELQGFAHFEMPKKIGLLEHDFSIERGELTPKLSVKRRVVDKTYKDVIDRLYQDEREAATV